jgi:hypothetical protein
MPEGQRRRAVATCGGAQVAHVGVVVLDGWVMSEKAEEPQ